MSISTAIYDDVASSAKILLPSMEALQLQDAAFVRERFQQLQQAEAEQPTPHRKKKLAVLEAILTRLCATSEADAAMTLRRQDARDANAPVPLKELPLPTQVALRMFFRTCQSLRDPARLASNCRLAVQLASRLPGLLTAMPSCVLSPGLVEDAPTGAETDGSLWSVFYQLFQLLEELVAGESVTLSAGDRATVVVAYVALSLKWGRLRDLLKGVKLLLESGDDIEPARFEPIMPLLRELAAASAERPQMASEEQPCGFLMSFGKGDHGKLGHGQCSHVSCQEGNCTENKTVPTMIVATRDVLFRKIDSLSTHSIAITAKGEAMAWGNGDKYRLGHGSSSKEYTPRTIEFLSLKGRVRDLACGLGHTLALMESGELFAWGNGSNGRLGLGDTNDRSSPTRVLMPILSGKQEGESTIDLVSLKGAPVRFRHVFCGASHSLGISWEGRAYAWGKNNQGQCGHGHTNDQWTVQEIESFSDNEEGEEDECIIYAAGGWEHTLFCADSGRVYSCGCGYKDSRRAGIPPVLGHGDCERRLKPTLIQALNDAREEIVRVACGWDHSLAVSASGKVYTWGSGTNGKLGHGDEESFDIPILVRSMEGKRVKDAKAGCEHTAFLTADHELWTCGQGDSGRLGHGDNQTRKRPAKVELFTECGLKPVALAVGDKYNLVLVTDGDNHYDYERESGENTFRNRAHQVNYHSSKQVSIDASGKGYHGHPRKLLHKKPINSHQEKFGANWTLNIAMGSTPNAATASTNALKKDGFTPDSASAVALYIIGHLDRLASAYITDAFDAQLEKRHDLKSPETRPNAQSVLLPFAVDTSCESLYALLQLLRWTTSSAGIEEKGLRIEMSGLDTMSWTFQNRLAVVLSCLRVLQLNLKKSLDVATLNLGGIDSSSKFFNSMDLIGEMHGFLDSIANLKGEGIVNYFGTGARRLECADNSVDIGNAVSYEAACALKVRPVFFISNAVCLVG
ncbi:unnamed protein product [Phytophthora lilii]|uniref:Unnamed protein product n=1 Tax=Phytophthora lilii TaxID=2077276 RepID=A0A9W6WVN7_9STRA|nr:unnamed protein product [Phytophthora lilii]